MSKVNGTQSGDPAKAARAMHQVAKMDDPPPRIVLGTDAYNMLQNKLKEDSERLQKYEKLIKSTDIDQ